MRHKGIDARIAKLSGKYVSTDFVWCGAGEPHEGESWARDQLSNEAVILPNVFSLRSVVIVNPRYEVRRYEKLPEGEVPMGIRRSLSDFYGAGPKKDAITVLEVFEPGDKTSRVALEILDDDTLWDLWDAPWLFEWRRDGAKPLATSLQERCRSGGGTGRRPLHAVEKAGVLWGSNGADGPKRVLADKGKFGKTLADGQACFAFFEQDGRYSNLRVLRCAADNTVLFSESLSREGWEAANAIDRTAWLGGNRLFVEAHVNPSLAFGVEIDLGKRTRKLFAGTAFAWDRAGKRLAFIAEPPHFGTPRDVPAKLMLGDETLSDLPARSHPELLWNDDGRLLTVIVPAADGRRGELVVVTFPDSGPRRVERFELSAAKERR